MKKITLGIALFTAASAFAQEQLPTPVGTLNNAKIELCAGEKREKIADTYIDAVFALDGVDGFGGANYLAAGEAPNPFPSRCAVITVYIDMTKYDAIHKRLGDTLNGQLLQYVESGGPGQF